MADNTNYALIGLLTLITANLATCGDSSRQRSIERELGNFVQETRPKIEQMNFKIERLYERVNSSNPIFITRYEFGNEKPEEFYEIDGRKAYVVIDGMPIEQYLKQKGSVEVEK